MVQLWVVLGLAISATAVSILGAAFSILGLGKLFSGAVLAVWLMAGSLELAKFVVAAYLHQTWSQLGLAFRSYLLSSVMILSLITSMGIFGFLSDAYTTSSSVLETESIRLQRLENEQQQATAEIDRLTRSVDEIPDRRITKKLKARAEIEPMIRVLQEKSVKATAEIADAKIKIVEVKQKVGPLIYIAKSFNKDIDSVVKYLILVFVSVFDPLAICLVVALSDALRKRASAKAQPLAQRTSQRQDPPQEEVASPGSVDADKAGLTPENPPPPATLRLRFADEQVVTPPKVSSSEEAG